MSIGQTHIGKHQEGNIILPGAYQTEMYLQYLKNKRVAVFANHTSVINKVHLIDTLIKHHINVVKIFAPEHGFRGTADAGEKINNNVDSATQIPIISLYGKKLKPNAYELSDVDIMLFDIQDVGVRFYTFISSLQYFIEAAIDNDKPLIILDRPNPNGFYIDGPVLDSAYKSFVGMQPIPIVYGMTIGEYAKMLIGEKWLDWKYIRKADDKISLTEILGFETERKNFKLVVIPCKNYTHKSKYVLPVKPSPNLPTMASIYWYPSTCLFEGTVISEGRGTEHPFCIFGHPSFSSSMYEFLPKPTVGAKEPKFKNTKCYGWNVFNNSDTVITQLHSQIQIKYIIEAYKMFADKESFFNKPKTNISTDYFFNKLAGNSDLMQQIQQNKTEQEIRNSWQKKLTVFKKIRKKYLMYPDFY
ncbi:MAG: exo-beta-N-acetylmuramidase NamZ domain-containing protein [Chitinophagaceae bacterium]